MIISDKVYMKRAIRIATKGVGKTSPNPAVGCVIVKDNQIVGSGWHKKAGLAHAEVDALLMAGDKANGADVFVTLEPCSHTGRTPACAKALIAARVKRVIAGMVDPNPLVSGKGLAMLADAGIIVEHGLLEKECRAINLPFIKQITTGLPYLVYKSATSMDGNIATFSGDSEWVSSEESRRHVHRLRSIYDAVMIGVDTAISDKPLLTVRHVRGRNPIRIIVDSHLRTPENLGLVNGDMAKGTIIATTETDPLKRQKYSSRGVTLITCRSDNNRVSTFDLMQKLGEHGIQSIMLEGGSKLAGDLLQKGLIDEFIFFIAPKIVGNIGIKPFTIDEITCMNRSFKLNFGKIARSGQDFIIHAWPEKTCLPD